jgi:2'-5' RNA ligase
MRCFVAVEIDESTREALGALQAELAVSVDIRKSDVKWVNPGNIHITLKFLGEIKDEQSVEVCRAAAEVTGRHSGFDIDVRGVGCFGGRSARVVWVGTAGGSAELAALAADMDETLAAAGFAPEQRKFSAHLTLCRVRNPKAGFKLAEAVKKYEDFEVGVVAAESVSVFQSELTPKGPVYTLLGSYGLK